MNKDYSFNFCCPTEIYFRPNGVSSIGKILKDDYNFHKVFLIYGGESIRKNGTYEKVITSLNENDIAFLEYGGIQANPDVEDINKIITTCKTFHPEIILAVGGGSVLDTAKCVAHGYYYAGNPLDFAKGVVEPLHALPVATILTLAASGSEMSDSCVVSDRKHHFKGGFNCKSNYPLFSLMDPMLTFTVPQYQVGIGLVDMFSHSFERYFSPSHEFEPSDELALGVMKAIVDISKAAIEKPEDLEVKRAMMICGSLAHNGITSYGKKKRFVVHAAEHYLSGVYPSLAHGQGIALLIVDFLRRNEDTLSQKISRFGEAVFSLEKGCSTKDSIDAFEGYIYSLPIYHTFSELPFVIKEEDVKKAQRKLLLSKK